MVLVKCKCGCFYTLNPIGFQKDSNKVCPNCGKTHKLDEYSSISSVDNVYETDLVEVQRIPDDATIEVSYRLR